MTTALLKDGAAAVLAAINGDTYVWQGVRFYVFRGRPCVIAADVGRYLGYADDGRSLVERVRGEWRDQFGCGRDFDVLEREDLRDFKAISALSTGNVVSRNARSLTILYEPGVDKVSLKTEKPQGVALRQALVDEVLPKLRRGEAVQPTAAVPVFAPAPQPAALAPVQAAPMTLAIVETMLVEQIKPLHERLETLRRQIEILIEGNKYVTPDQADIIHNEANRLMQKWKELGWSPSKRSAAQAIRPYIYSQVVWDGTNQTAKYLPKVYYDGVRRALTRQHWIADQSLRRIGLLPSVPSPTAH